MFLQTVYMFFSFAVILVLTYIAVQVARDPDTPFLAVICISLVKQVIFLVFNVLTRYERHWTMSGLELSLGLKIVISQIIMTFTVALAGDAATQALGSCAWYNVGSIFATNAALSAVLTPFLDYLRPADWMFAHPKLKWLLCYDATGDADQMFPAYMLTLYTWFVRLLYMAVLCVTFGGLFPSMYWFGLFEVFARFYVDNPNPNPNWRFSPASMSIGIISFESLLNARTTTQPSAIPSYYRYLSASSETVFHVDFSCTHGSKIMRKHWFITPVIWSLF